jgi:hypothetical protein
MIDIFIIWTKFFYFIGNADLINKLRTDARLIGHKSAVAGLNDLEILFRYLTLFGVMDKVMKIKQNFIFLMKNLLDYIRFKISSWFGLLYWCYF